MSNITTNHAITKTNLEGIDPEKLYRATLRLQLSQVIYNGWYIMVFVQVTSCFAVICETDINTVSDISKLLYAISRAVRQVKFEAILKISRVVFMPNITYKSCYYLFIAELHAQLEAPRLGGAPQLKEMWQSTHPRKFGNHGTVHRPSVRTTGIQNQLVWQHKCYSRFYLEGNHIAPGTLKRKNNNKVLSFSAIFFMFSLTWITEKELERVIENKGDEFRRKKNMEIQSGREKMQNARGQQGESERQ